MARSTSATSTTATPVTPLRSEEVASWPEAVESVIVGSGFSGIGMAIRLKQAGHEDFLLLEQAASLGGTWRDNDYPGCACDIPSTLYSFSFAPNPYWTRRYAPQGEILGYLTQCARRFGLQPHLRMRARLTKAEWNESAQKWDLWINDSIRLRARFLISGIGGLSRPLIPQIPGADTFKGEQFHSARWHHQLDLTGKRIAVIGTGASAIQFVPQIADKAAQVTLLQRTPAWILPKPDAGVPWLLRQLYHQLPGSQTLRRHLLYWQHEARALGFAVNPKILKLAEGLAKRHLRKQISDPQLREKLTPDYTMGCKRILLSNDFYPALMREHVALETTGIAQIKDHAIVLDDGREVACDVIIYGTGFDVMDPLGSLQVIGREGREIRETWTHGPQAYLGITAHQLPNFFFLMGPNTGLGHNSMVFMIEAQVDYVLRCIQSMQKRRDQSWEVTQSAQAGFIDEVMKKSARAVWTSGCKSWYLDAQGRNVSVWPDFTWKYWLRTRLPRRFDYLVN